MRDATDSQEAPGTRLDSHNPSRKEIGRRSANSVVPLLMSLTQPASVIDVGCGVGNWLAAFRDCGITDVFGVDQNDYGAELRVPREHFAVADLRSGFRSERRFDLVVCLEMAEHLPEAAAPILVQSLAALGDVVVFSAAIPFQGGANHRNERWPEYWRDLFANYDFFPIDCIRPRIWENKDVAWWYTQNVLLYVRREYLAAHDRLRREVEHPVPYPLALVHPGLYMKHVTAREPTRQSPIRRISSALRRLGGS